MPRCIRSNEQSDHPNVHVHHRLWTSSSAVSSSSAAVSRANFTDHCIYIYSRYRYGYARLRTNKHSQLPWPAAATTTTSATTTTTTTVPATTNATLRHEPQRSIFRRRNRQTLVQPRKQPSQRHEAPSHTHEIRIPNATLYSRSQNLPATPQLLPPPPTTELLLRRKSKHDQSEPTTNRLFHLPNPQPIHALTLQPEQPSRLQQQ